MKGCAVLVADPPWKFGDALPGKTRGASKQYPTMTVRQICDYPLPKLADDALLFLWRVSAMPDAALDVARCWGFEPKSELTWVKMTKTGLLHFGMGRYVRAAHEGCLIASRGRGSSLIVDHSVRSVFFAKVGVHSEKPAEFYGLVDQMVTHANRPPLRKVELFARGAPRAGWERYGLEAAGSPAAPVR